MGAFFCTFATPMLAPRQPRTHVPDLVGSRFPSPYHFRARIQSFQGVAAPFPGDSVLPAASRAATPANAAWELRKIATFRLQARVRPKQSTNYYCYFSSPPPERAAPARPIREPQGQLRHTVTRIPFSRKKNRRGPLPHPKGHFGNAASRRPGARSGRIGHDEIDLRPRRNAENRDEIAGAQQLGRLVEKALITGVELVRGRGDHRMSLGRRRGMKLCAQIQQLRSDAELSGPENIADMLLEFIGRIRRCGSIHVDNRAGRSRSRCDGGRTCRDFCPPGGKLQAITAIDRRADPIAACLSDSERRGATDRRGIECLIGQLMADAVDPIAENRVPSREEFIPRSPSLRAQGSNPSLDEKCC